MGLLLFTQRSLECWTDRNCATQGPLFLDRELFFQFFWASWSFMLIYLPLTSRPLISLQKAAVLSPCNFATCILNCHRPVSSRPMKRRTLSQRPSLFFVAFCVPDMEAGGCQNVGGGYRTPNCTWKTLPPVGARLGIKRPSRDGRKQGSTKISFLGRWGGSLPRKGVVVAKFVPSLESLSSLDFVKLKGGIWDVPGILLSRTAKFRAWSVSPQGLMCSLLSANQGDSLHRMTRKGLGCFPGVCPEFRSDFALEFARNSLGKRSGPAMRGTLHPGPLQQVLNVGA